VLRGEEPPLPRRLFKPAATGTPILEGVVASARPGVEVGLPPRSASSMGHKSHLLTRPYAAAAPSVRDMRPSHAVRFGSSERAPVVRQWSPSWSGVERLPALAFWHGCAKCSQPCDSWPASQAEGRGFDPRRPLKKKPLRGVRCWGRRKRSTCPGRVPSREFSCRPLTTTSRRSRASVHQWLPGQSRSERRP
jgi:hypothetical protein